MRIIFYILIFLLISAKPVQAGFYATINLNLSVTGFIENVKSATPYHVISGVLLEKPISFQIFHLTIIGLLLIILLLVHLRSVRIKKAKQALKASEEKFRKLAENSAEVIWVCDLNLQLTYISPSTEKLFGYPREERLLKSMNEVFNEESVVKMKEELQKNLELHKKNRKELKSIQIELTGRHKDGREVWVEVNADFIYDDNNIPIGLQGNARDITERKNAEIKMLKMMEDMSRQDRALLEQNKALTLAQKAIEKTSKQYHDLFENGPVGYLILDENGLVEEMNSSSSQMIGCAKQEVIGNSFTNFIDESEKERFTADLLATIEKKQVHQQIFRLAKIYVKIVFVPDTVIIKNNCRIVLIDVTGEVKAREELSGALHSLQSVFNAIPIGIAVVSPDFTILNMNERLLKIQKLEKAAIYLGKKCHEVFNCGKTPCDECPWKQVLDTGKSIIRNSSPDDLLYKEGDYRIYSCPMFNDDGKITGIVEAVMDISNLKKAEFALEESERKFEDLFNEIPDAVFITGIGDQSGNILNVNPAAERQTGYSRHELLKMNVLNDISEESERSKLSKVREEKLVRNDKIELTERKRRKDGTYIWTEVLVQKIVIDGRPLALSVSRDITERVQIQENLKNSEARVRSLLSALPDILFVLDRDGYFLEYHTDSHSRLILPPEAFLHKKIEDVLPAHLAQITIENIQKTFDTGEMQMYNYSLETAQGTNYFDVRMVRASEDSVLTIVRNITDARKAEADRKQNEEKFKTLFLNTPLGVFNFDKHSVILNCNENFEKIIGSGLDKLTGFNILKQTNDEKLKSAVLDAIQSGKGYYEGHYKSVTSGKVTPVKAFFKSICDESGNFIDGIGIVEDVTEQKKYEKNLLDALKRAEQSDKLKSSFMATMSHELRTPLNTVIGFADIIDETMPVDQVVEFTGMISKSGRHLLSIIEDILDISLIDSGEAKMVFERFYMAELMDGLYNLASREKIVMQKDHLEVKLNLEDSIKHLKLSGDIRKINKVFAHLIKNAIKFTRQGSIEIGAYQQNEPLEKDNILFYVKDSGIGIPVDKHDIIFEIFRQVDDSSTREYEGTGLGLSISRKLIHLMGGEIWLKSEPGMGSTFYFNLPLLGSASKVINVRNKYNKPEVKNSSGINVLVAEDDDTNFHLFKLLLTRKNMKVVRALNGEEAILIISTDKDIQLVLMDINMPVLNGYDATRKIKALRSDLPIIAVTAYAMSGDKLRAEDAGCDDYITKPINNTIFYETIAKHIK
ncbi:MAG: PAS domain S-box protein [Bacteroidales bacterium]|nr:PAS domain S-box protein [Bacteroidales bacterium]